MLFGQANLIEKTVLLSCLVGGLEFGTFFIFPYIGNVIIPIDQPDVLVGETTCLEGLHAELVPVVGLRTFPGDGLSLSPPRGKPLLKGSPSLLPRIHSFLICSNS